MVSSKTVRGTTTEPLTNNLEHPVHPALVVVPWAGCVYLERVMMVTCEYCGKELTNKKALNCHKTQVHFDTFEERFWDKVDKGDKQECWEWQGAISGDGYANAKLNGNDHHASRAYFLGILGIELSQNVHALHHCDNPICVNPNHLYLGTHQDNIDDRTKRNSQTGESNPNAKLSNEQVEEIRVRLEKGEETQREIAKDYPVNRPAISKISTGYRHSIN